MNNVWILTDLHLYSTDPDVRHPFRTTRKLGILGDNFSQDIDEGDVTIFLGDLCDPEAADYNKMAAVIGSIPGKKYMCRGNHDTQDDSYYLGLGFDAIADVIRVHNILFSHKPIRVAPDEINIHGHLHMEKMSGLSPNHINAYAANWNKDDHPVLLEDLLDSATVQQLEVSAKDWDHATEKFKKYTSYNDDYYEHFLDLSEKFNFIGYSDKIEVVVDESAIGEKKGFYHLSVDNLDGQTLTPRIPDNFLVREGYEDKTTKRVCLSPFIDNALVAMSDNLKDKEFYVHVPAERLTDIKHPTEKQVPDVHITREIWALKPVKLKCIGKIHVTEANDIAGTYQYGDQKAELYSWCWEWIEEPVDESVVLSNKDLQHNVDKWGLGKDQHNVLYITGFSGSGKSTLAEQMERDYNANLVELDGVEWCYDASSSKLIERTAKTFPAYNKIYQEVQKTGKPYDWTDDEVQKILYPMMKKVIAAAESEKDTLYIIEGLQLYELYDGSHFKGKSIIVKGTSFIKSRIRAYRRDKPSVTNWIKQIAANWPDEKILSDFKKGINESIWDIPRNYKPGYISMWQKESDTLVDETLYQSAEDVEYFWGDDNERKKKENHAKESQKSVVGINESWIIQKGDLQINMENWAPGDPLWITGSSGDGKSTLAEKMATESHAIVINSDIVLCRMLWTKEKYEKVLKTKTIPGSDVWKFNLDSPAWDYVASHPNLPFGAKDPITHSTIDSITQPEIIAFYHWLMVELKSNPKYKDNLYIIEGCDICLLDPNVMATKPLIIMGGSRLQSLWRRVKRNVKDKNASYIESIFKYLKKYNYQAKRLDDDKDNFRRDIENVLQESSLDENIRLLREALEKPTWPDIATVWSDTTNPNDPKSSKGVEIQFYDDDTEDHIGTACISGIDIDDGYLYDFEVFKEFRGQHYAHSMMYYILTHYTVTTLIVKPNNHAAIHLYEKFGFKKHGTYEENGIKYLDMRRKKGKSVITESATSASGDIWYHMLPAGSNIAYGIMSPRYMADHNMTKLLTKSLDKYRDRMVGAWDIYPGRDPDSLTNQEILDGLNKFRGEGGDSAIYLFRFPPTEKLGPNMRKVLQHKHIYPIDLTKIPDIVSVDYTVNNGPGKEWFDAVDEKKYFSTYDDDAEKHGKLLFAGIPHISIITKSGRIESTAFAGTVLRESTDTDPVDREEKAKLTKKYGIDNVGHAGGSEEIEREEKELAEMKRRAAIKDKEKALQKKTKARNKQLKKARGAKKRKAFVNKVKSILPGVKNEDASAVDNPGIDWFNSQMNESGTESEVSIQETYQFKLQDKVQFFDTVTESAKTSDKKLLPVYVVIMHTGTTLSTMIKTAIGSEFSHASISFDSSLSNMYSFARKLSDDGKASHSGGFRIEDIHNKFFQDREIKYAMYVVPCTEDQIKLMKKRLDYFKKNQSKFTYDFTGLIKSYFHISDNPEYRWFCTRFVADILNAGRPTDPYVQDPFLVRPDDFQETNFAYYVTSGYLNEYDQKVVDATTKRILNTKKIQKAVQNEFASLPVDNPYERHILNYQMAMMDENALSTFIQYIKSFKVRFDSEGNILITRREYDQLDAHFRESLRMIKTCESAGNVAGVKDELCKIHYMIELINQYYLKENVKNLRPNAKDVRKDMLDLRSVMMNAFKYHMKWVTTQEPNWNFMQHYDASKYSRDLVVPAKLVTMVGKSIMTKL